MRMSPNQCSVVPLCNHCLLWLMREGATGNSKASSAMQRIHGKMTWDTGGNTSVTARAGHGPIWADINFSIVEVVKLAPTAVDGPFASHVTDTGFARGQALATLDLLSSSRCDLTALLRSVEQTS